MRSRVDAEQEANCVAHWGSRKETIELKTVFDRELKWGILIF
jgi:hypothetical protein